MKKVDGINIYCDETRVENPDSSTMVIGAVFIPRVKKVEVITKLKEIFQKHHFTRELKWSKSSKLFDACYKEVLDYFADNGDILFRCILVDKSKVDYATYHEDDEELAFFKFYYLMLRSRLVSNNQYYIFLDRKPIRDKSRARALKHYLDAHVLFKTGCTIEHLQAYSSQDNLLIQLADFLTGLVGYSANQDNSSFYKQTLVDYLAQKLNKESLDASTPLSEDKFNVFSWSPKK